MKVFKLDDNNIIRCLVLISGEENLKSITFRLRQLYSECAYFESLYSEFLFQTHPNLSSPNLNLIWSYDLHALTWGLLIFIYFLPLKQRLRSFGYCAPKAFIYNLNRNINILLRSVQQKCYILKKEKKEKEEKADCFFSSNWIPTFWVTIGFPF